MQEPASAPTPDDERQASRRRPLLSDIERARIDAAVTAAERHTRGEIVPVVLRASDTYPGARWRLAVAFALLSVTAAMWALPAVEPLIFIAAMVPLLGIGHLLAALPPVLRLGLSAAEVDEEVRQQARDTFLSLGLHTTREHTGVLILVSLLEHRIEVMADRGIDAVAPEDLWTDVVDRLRRRIQDDHLTDGLIEAITRCGALLAEHFPRRDDDTNELPDRVIT